MGGFCVVHEYERIVIDAQLLGDLSVRSRKGGSSRQGYMVKGQTRKTGNK